MLCNHIVNCLNYIHRDDRDKDMVQEGYGILNGSSLAGEQKRKVKINLYWWKLNWLSVKNKCLGSITLIPQLGGCLEACQGLVI